MDLLIQVSEEDGADLKRLIQLAAKYGYAVKTADGFTLAAPPEPRVVRQCQECGTEFQSHTRKQIFCTKKCSRASHWRLRGKARLNAKVYGKLLMRD